MTHFWYKKQRRVRGARPKRIAKGDQLQGGINNLEKDEQRWMY